MVIKIDELEKLEIDELVFKFDTKLEHPLVTRRRCGGLVGACSNLSGRPVLPGSLSERFVLACKDSRFSKYQLFDLD